MIDGDALIVHTIYRDPADFPGLYVGRAHAITPDGLVFDPKPFAVARTLEEVRSAVPGRSVINLGRGPEDDPCIVESWV